MPPGSTQTIPIDSTGIVSTLSGSRRLDRAGAGARRKAHGTAYASATRQAILADVTPAHHGVDVGQPAPRFTLTALHGETVDLAAYRGRQNVVVWFSRGFTCPFCLASMDGVREGYADLRAIDTEVIQVAPNLLEGARSFFAHQTTPFPFVCDPDKRLYAVYGLGDRGALVATRTAVVSFAHAVSTGEGGIWVRGAYLDVANKNFLRRLHHHATSALEQGIFLIDKRGVVRHRLVVGPVAPVPGGIELAALTRQHCPDDSPDGGDAVAPPVVSSAAAR